MEHLQTSNDELKELIHCEICNQIYESPVILPCFHTVCLNHIDFGLKYKCVFCNQIHQIPDNGFPFDSRVMKLIRINENYIKIDKINYGKINRSAKESCQQLEDLLDQSQTLAIDPYFYIHNYFSKLKNDIDLKKEEYILMIETSHEKIIRDIEHFENKCKFEAQMKSLNLYDLIKVSKNKLEKWNADLRVPDFDHDGNWKRITIRAKEESEKLKTLITNFQDDLLMYKELKFLCRPIMAKNNFGDILFIDKEKIDSNRVEGTFQLVINDFSLFKRNYEWKESSKSCVIKNIPWKINAKIEQTENYDLALGFYVYPEYDDHKLQQNPVNTEIRIKIVQDKSMMNTKLKLYRRFAHTYMESIGSGCPSFMLLRDIMDPMNGIYDRKNDCITLEATVKIIDN